MKTKFRSGFVPFALWVAATVAAYWIGMSQQSRSDALVDSHNRKGSLNGTNNNSAANAKKAQNNPLLGHGDPNEELASRFVRDPDKGIIELEKLPPGKSTQDAYQDVFEELASIDALRAAALALNLSPGPNRAAALTGVQLIWLGDPKALLDWASTAADTDPDVLQSSLMMVVKSEEKPALAAQYLDKIADPSARNQVITAIASVMSQSDPAGTLSFLGQVASGMTYNNNVQILFGNLSKHDPPTAATLINQLTDLNTRQAVIATLATNWGQSDPQAAVLWTQTLQGADATSALNSVLSGWAQNDPKSVLAYITGTADPSTYYSAVPALAQSMSASDPQSALALVQSLPDGSTKDKALNSALLGMAKSNFAYALDYAINLPVGSNRDTEIGSLVGLQANASPAQAAKLLDQIPAGNAQLNAASTVAAAWVKQNSPTFLDWLGGLPEGDVRDAAIVQLDSSGQAAKHPSAVFAQANSISNPDLRAVQIQTVLINWAVKDPQAALAAAQNANLPDDQRASLVQKLTQSVTRSKNSP